MSWVFKRVRKCFTDLHSVIDLGKEFQRIRTSLVPTDISQQREALHRGWGTALCAAPQPRCSDQPYQADSDGGGHDMVWLDLSARY